MLHYLAEYARREGVTAVPGLKPKRVKWLLLFDEAGCFLGVQDLTGGDRKSKGREFSNCPDLTQSEMVAAGGGCRPFLVDSVSVVTLLAKGDEVDDKLRQKHDYFIDLLRQASTHVPELASIADLLGDAQQLAVVRKQLSEKKAKPTELISIGVADEEGRPHILLEDDRWHGWWLAFRQQLADARAARQSSKRARRESSLMIDVLSGEPVEPERTQPKVEGLSDVGGLPTGDVLAGFDKDAFTSYGLVQGANAAMSEQSAKTYVAALNHLIQHRSRRVGGVRVAYWYSGTVPDEFDAAADLLGDWAAEAAEDDDAGNGALERRQAETRARRALEAIRSGQRPDLANYRYYAITLSGNSGRVVVRDWTEGRFEELVDNVNAWFDELAIVHRDGRSVVTQFKFNAVLAAPVRELKDAPGPLGAALWRCAIRRAAIPAEIAAQTLQRVRVDFIQGEAPRHARLGLLKAFCIRNPGVPNMTPELNELEANPAYLSGRIMAVLGRIQREAMPEVGTGVVQRYYAAASATPALVLGRLVRTAQIAHLPKIENEGLRGWFEKQLTELWSKLQGPPPRMLSLEGQTLFAMGYYHQLAYRGRSASGEQAAETPA